jgi:hypothetical protein
MNEKIRELAEQAMEHVSEPIWDEDSGMYYREYGFKLNPEKFAELIVLECIGIIAGGKNLHDEAPDAKSSRKYITNIKKHFGVKP